MAFRVHLNVVDECGQREIFEMGEQCNEVDHTDDKFCRFVHMDKETLTSKVLMIVPYENILYIEQIEED